MGSWSTLDAMSYTLGAAAGAGGALGAVASWRRALNSSTLEIAKTPTSGKSGTRIQPEETFGYVRPLVVCEEGSETY